MSSLLALSACSMIPKVGDGRKPLPLPPVDPAQAATLTIMPFPAYALKTQRGLIERQEFTCDAQGQVAQRAEARLAEFSYDVALRDGVKDFKPVQTTVPAGPAHFWMVRYSSDKSCSFSFSVRFEAGHHYQLASDTVGEGFFSKGSCVMAIVDTDTRLPLKIVDLQRNLTHFAA